MAVDLCVARGVVAAAPDCCNAYTMTSDRPAGGLPLHKHGLMQTLFQVAADTSKAVVACRRHESYVDSYTETPVEHELVEATPLVGYTHNHPSSLHDTHRHGWMTLTLQHTGTTQQKSAMAPCTTSRTLVMHASCQSFHAGTRQAFRTSGWCCQSSWTAWGDRHQAVVLHLLVVADNTADRPVVPDKPE